MVSLLAAADPILLLLVALLLTINRLLMAFKWWLLLEAKALAIGFWTTVRAYYVGSFAGLFLPMTVGGDLVRVIAVRSGSRIVQVVASVVLERALGALSQVLLATLSVVLIVELELGWPTPGLGWIIAGLLALLLAGLPLSFALAQWVARVWGNGAGWRGKIGEMAHALVEWRRHPLTVGVFLLLTVIEGFLPVTIHFVAARALGLSIPFILFLSTIPLVFLVARLPISLGGIGVVEGSFVYLAGILGIPSAEAFSIAILAEIVLILTLFPGAAAYLLTPHVQPREG